MLAVFESQEQEQKLKSYVKVRTETLICKLINSFVSLCDLMRLASAMGRKALLVLFLCHWQNCFKGFDIQLINNLMAKVQIISIRTKKITEKL